MLDPAAATPYYDISLTNALRVSGVETSLISSRFIHETEVPQAEQCTDFFFFRPLARWAETLRHTPWLRRIIRLTIYPLDLYRLWLRFRQAPPDVLHVQWTWLPLLDRLLFRCMSEHVPVILTVHNPNPRQARFARIADMRPLYGLATRLIVHTEENRRALLAHANIDPERVQVIPHGPLFEEQPTMSREAARGALGLEINSGVVLFFGIIQPYKGLLDLIEAMALIYERHPNTRLVIAGKPTGSAQPYLNRLAEYGLEDATVLRLGFIPSEQVPILFAASDVVCLPYLEASQSGVLLTAYRFGKPVVVTNVGGLPESVDIGNNGYVVPPANPPALAEALVRLLIDPALRERFAERSKELAQTEYSWKRAAALTTETYRRAIAESSPKKISGEGHRV